MNFTLQAAKSPITIFRAFRAKPRAKWRRHQSAVAAARLEGLQPNRRSTFASLKTSVATPRSAGDCEWRRSTSAAADSTRQLDKAANSAKTAAAAVERRRHCSSPQQLGDVSRPKFCNLRARVSTFFSSDRPPLFDANHAPLGLENWRAHKKQRARVKPILMGKRVVRASKNVATAVASFSSLNISHVQSSARSFDRRPSKVWSASFFVCNPFSARRFACCPTSKVILMRRRKTCDGRSSSSTPPLTTLPSPCESRARARSRSRAASRHFRLFRRRTRQK